MYRGKGNDKPEVILQNEKQEAIRREKAGQENERRRCPGYIPESESGAQFQKRRLGTKYRPIERRLSQN